MINLLYVSEYIPYPQIGHAGGQTFNYYYSNMCDDPDFDVTLVGVCNEDEVIKISAYSKKSKIIESIAKGNFFTNCKRVLFDLWGKLRKKNIIQKSYYKSYLIENKIRELYKSGYRPDVIVLEWTQMLSLVKNIKHYFPKSKYIASEHDVTFVRYWRMYKQKQTLKNKRNYENVYSLEINSLKNVDIIMPHSGEDKRRLCELGFEKNRIFTLTPFFNNMINVKRENINHDILFWGAMYRQENYEAALWFIEKVIPKLKDLPVRFVVVGNRPPEILRNKQCENIVITGFVDNPVKYFQHSLCFVSPLKMGAGIKIKILEAMSSGIPVLTNEIGIEGIDAVNEKDFFLCNNEDDYERIIRALFSGVYSLKSIESNQRNLIYGQFNLKGSLAKYKQIIKNLNGEN